MKVELELELESLTGSLWLEVCVTHHPGHAITFVGCGDCPEFSL